MSTTTAVDFRRAAPAAQPHAALRAVAVGFAAVPSVAENSTQAEWQARFGRPEPKIVCLGLNYHTHAEEQSVELPKAPLLFGKFANTLCGDGDPIVLPAGIGHVDAEAELAVVIGRRAHAVSEADALSYVAGYTCANDVSARDAQHGDGQWFRGKGYDTFCPVGPRIVDAGDLDPSDLQIQQRLNGDVLQDSRTSMLIFSIPELIAYISNALTLEPGDLILTGTPGGVGVFREPKVALQDGDVVEIEVEGIGILRNVVSSAR
jgi:2-keto-4-pentenoate hydratase/2-oxohepta-3-ene-1,7-dioic acid hydratase in catechol pathway